MPGWKHAFTLSKEAVKTSTPPGTVALIEHAAVLQDGHYVDRVVNYPVPTEDPADPLTWPRWRKISCLATICLYAFVANYIAASIAPALPVWNRDFRHDHRPAADLARFVALNVLALGLGNIFWVPVASAFGRRLALVLSTSLLSGATTAGIFVTGYKNTLILRILQGLGSSASETVAPAVIGDLFFVHQRGKRMSGYMAALASGSVTGGIVGGYIAAEMGWMKQFWVGSALTAVTALLTFLLVPETLYERGDHGLPMLQQTVQHLPSNTGQENRNQENSQQGNAEQEPSPQHGRARQKHGRRKHAHKSHPRENHAEENHAAQKRHTKQNGIPPEWAQQYEQHLRAQQEYAEDERIRHQRFEQPRVAPEPPRTNPDARRAHQASREPRKLEAAAEQVHRAGHAAQKKRKANRAAAAERRAAQAAEEARRANEGAPRYRRASRAPRLSLGMLPSVRFTLPPGFRWSGLSDHQPERQPQPRPERELQPRPEREPQPRPEPDPYHGMTWYDSSSTKSEEQPEPVATPAIPVSSSNRLDHSRHNHSRRNHSRDGHVFQANTNGELAIAHASPAGRQHQQQQRQQQPPRPPIPPLPPSPTPTPTPTSTPTSTSSTPQPPFRPYTFRRSLGFAAYRGNLCHHFARPWTTLRLPAVWAFMLQYGSLIGGAAVISTVGPEVLANRPYRWGPHAGFLFLGALVGILLGAACTALVADKLLKKRATSQDEGFAEPESRLGWVMLPALTVAAVGVGVFGFCAQRRAEEGWVGMECAFGMVSFALAQVPSVWFNYFIDSYSQLASDCLVMVCILRALIPFVWTFFVAQWIERSGFTTPFSSFAGIVACFSLLTIPIILYGKRMRIATAKYVVASQGT